MSLSISYESESGGAASSSADLLLLRAITQREELLARLKRGGCGTGTLAAFRRASVECVEQLCQRQLTCGTAHYRWRQHASYMYKMGRDTGAVSATVAEALRRRHRVVCRGARNPLLLPDYPPQQGSAAAALASQRGGLLEGGGGLDWKRVERAARMVEHVARGPRPQPLGDDPAASAAAAAAAAERRRREAAAAGRAREAAEEAAALRVEARQARVEQLAAQVEVRVEGLCAMLLQAQEREAAAAAAAVATAATAATADTAATTSIAAEEQGGAHDGKATLFGQRNSARAAARQQRPKTAPPARPSLLGQQQPQQQPQQQRCKPGARSRPQTASAGRRPDSAAPRKAVAWENHAGFLAWSFGVIEHSASKRGTR